MLPKKPQKFKKEGRLTPQYFNLKHFRVAALQPLPDHLHEGVGVGTEQCQGFGVWWRCQTVSADGGVNVVGHAAGVQLRFHPAEKVSKRSPCLEEVLLVGLGTEGHLRERGPIVTPILCWLVKMLPPHLGSEMSCQ